MIIVLSLRNFPSFQAMPERIFLTFADSKMRYARERICDEARRMRVYTRVIGAKESDLSDDFRSHFSAKLVEGCRGYGYWAWKPQIVKQTLIQMNEGDVVHWVDAGCHLNRRGRWRLQEYFSLADLSPTGVLGFQCRAPEPPFPHDGRELPDFRDSEWTKGDLLDSLGVRDNQRLLDQPCIGACTFMIRKCPNSLAFVDRWLSIPYEDFSLIDDSASRSPNPEGFKEHRHDQSIFSILAKLQDVTTVSVYESWYPFADDCNKPDWSMVKNYPIQVRRDRGHPSPRPTLMQVIRSKGSNGKTKLKKLLSRTGLMTT